MAGLTASETTAADSCCAPEQQTSCCEPSAKADCCGHKEGCGCAAGSKPTDVREQVRERYAAAAVQVTTTDPGAGCCAPSETFDGGSDVFGAALYALGDHEQLPDIAKLASLCPSSGPNESDRPEGRSRVSDIAGAGLKHLPPTPECPSGGPRLIKERWYLGQ